MKLLNQTSAAIVIPAFNEATTIGLVVQEIKKELSAAGCDFTIIVVDDGSRDGTPRIAQAAGAQVIRHILNTGSGGATATGLSAAYQLGYSIAATMDADGQHNPSDVLKGIELAAQGKYDLLIGSRLIDSAGMSKVKRLGNHGLSVLTFMLFGVYTTDSQSGLRVFSARALRELRWKTSGYEFCSEMLWRARQLGLTIGEYPIQAIYTEYSKSKGQNNWNAVNILKMLLRRRVWELFNE